MALSWEFVLAWCIAGLVLSFRTKELPSDLSKKLLLVLLMGPAVWTIAAGVLVTYYIFYDDNGIPK